MSVDLIEEVVGGVRVILLYRLHLVVEKPYLVSDFIIVCIPGLQAQSFFYLARLAHLKVLVNHVGSLEDSHLRIVLVAAVVLQFVDHILVEAIEAEEFVEVFTLEGVVTKVLVGCNEDRCFKAVQIAH